MSQDINFHYQTLTSNGTLLAVAAHLQWRGPTYGSMMHRVILYSLWVRTGVITPRVKWFTTLTEYMNDRCIYNHTLCHAGVELNIYEFLPRVFGGDASAAAVCDVIIYLPTPGIIFHPVSGGRVQTSLSVG